MEKKRSTKKTIRGRDVLIVIAGITAAFTICNFLLQSVWCHRKQTFSPNYEMQDLLPILEKESLTGQDYDTLFLQTGLAKGSIDRLLLRKETGVAEILSIQNRFFTRERTHCELLLGARFTCEDLLQDKEGNPVKSVPLAPLELGDIFVSYATHTMGWRHGHAGLVVDAEDQQVLEAVQMGTNSRCQHAEHWKRYSNFMILRVKDASKEIRSRVTDFARRNLEGIPYSLLSGLEGNKVQPVSSEMTAQCAYLPWRAWISEGFDLDGDSGKIITVQDLAESDALEIVQIYGIDPAPLLDRQSRN